MFDMTSGAIRKSSSLRCVAGFAAAAIAGLASLSAAQADEANAKNLVKAMSDYLAAQQAISFSYDFEPGNRYQRETETWACKFGRLDPQSSGQAVCDSNRRVR